MPRFKLANVLLQLPDQLRRYPQMLYRASGAVDFQEDDASLAFEGRLDFLTYFNAFSAEKWRRYTAVKEVQLHLELMGDACEVLFLGIEEGALDTKDAPNIDQVSTASLIKADVHPKQLTIPERFQGSAEFTALDLDVPVDDMSLVGFALVSKGATAIRNASWNTDVDADQVRDIRIAIATTTFKNEAYILPNIEMIRCDVLGSDDAVADALHLFVVDNGRTLDADALSDEHVTVIPNANEGGSAGFARGMMATLEADEPFTHVLLMDDDVRISPESIIRTYNLLSLATDEYANAFINGAMLEMECPSKQFEDVSHVLPSGVYRRLKGNLFMDTLVDVAMNEVIDVEVPRAYGAWWYSCIPLSAVKEQGLPLPIFVRCDDVEYGMRANPTYMTMNGICVWHTAFGRKFRAAVDCYQYIRNYLIMNALHGIASESLFLARADRTLQLYLRSMAYETAELIVDGLEDYLKGPEWLMDASGETIFKENNSKAERLVPLAEALASAEEDDPCVAHALTGYQVDHDILRDDQAAGRLLRLWRTIPYDRHLLPDRLIKDEAATAYYGGYTIGAPDQVGKRVLVACDREGETAHVRVMDRVRWRQIRRRWRRARADHKARGAEVASAYRGALAKMTSVKYWSHHLEG